MELKAAQGVDVAVTKVLVVKKRLLLLCLMLSSHLQAAVLPEERADILYHRYDGGGMEIDGPSVLVRKNFANKVSVWGNYYEDWISGASIDVLTQGSVVLDGPVYEEDRVETSIGGNYLHNKTLFSLSHTNSSENDYEANSYAFGVSQDFFGDLSTLSLNYSKGEDEVYRNQRSNGEIVGRDFQGTAEHQRYSVSLTQVITKHMIMSFTGETVVDEGFLRNPYRSFRFLDAQGNEQYQFERYPTTRTSDAFAIRGLYYLPYRAALRAEYRIFSDSWGIEASNYELAYIHPWEKWTFEAKYRGYEQTAASFFEDLATLAQAENQNFIGSDKELDAFTNGTFGLGVSYVLDSRYLSWFERSTVNLYWDFLSFDYENYRERTQSNSIIAGDDAVAPGEEDLYAFDAQVVRLFFSVWY